MGIVGEPPASYCEVPLRPPFQGPANAYNRAVAAQRRTSMRIAVGGIEHETCGFAEPGMTTSLHEFARTRLRGNELERLGAANTIVDGFVRGVRECGLELVPLL